MGLEEGPREEGRLAGKEGKGIDSRRRCYLGTFYGTCSKSKSLCFEGLDDFDPDSLAGSLRSTAPGALTMTEHLHVPCPLAS